MKRPYFTVLSILVSVCLLPLNSALAMMAYYPESVAVSCPQLKPGLYKCRPTSPRNVPPILVNFRYAEGTDSASNRAILLGLHGKKPVRIPCGQVKQENIFCDAKERLANPEVAKECQEGIGGANYFRIALQSSSNSSHLNTRHDVMIQQMRDNKIVSFLATSYKIDVLSLDSFRFFATHSGNLINKEEASTTDVVCRL